MKVFVTGAAGQLGHDVINELFFRGHQGIASDVKETYSGIQDGSPVTGAPYVPLDITCEDEVLKTLEDIRPDVVIHCAAWTAVDLAEDDENRSRVFSINADGTRFIAKACKALDIPMVYISTDYVFSGEGETPWEPDCKDFAPLNVYGESKLAGEQAVASLLQKYYIIRIAWVFGRNGNNFIRTMLKLGASHDRLRVVSDQIGTPTYTLDLAVLIVSMIESGKYGYYHATNEGGYISWFDFATEIFRQAAMLGHEEYDPDHLSVEPVSTAEYGISKAKRPFNSRLDKSKLVSNGFEPLPDWRDALSRYLKDIGGNAY